MRRSSSVHIGRKPRIAVAQRARNSVARARAHSKSAAGGVWDTGRAMDSSPADLAPITGADFHRVARYLNLNLNRSVPVSAWVRAMQDSWGQTAPNSGYFLSSHGVVVGACLAFYSERIVDGETEHFCNLGALCVDPDSRLHVLRLLRAVLSQPGYTFTDLSPSGNVVALNERLGFKYLDTTTALVVNAQLARRPRGSYVIADRAEIERRLQGDALRVFMDHKDAAAARHALLVDGPGHCYVVFRKVRRKRLPVFSSILYVSDQSVFARSSGALFAHMLFRHGALATLAELRVVGERPSRSILLETSRPKMYKSARLGPENIDYLYSELTSLAW